jgi:hypothetical protein
MRHHTAAVVILASLAYLGLAFIDRGTAISMILLYIALVAGLLRIGAQRER